MTKKLAKIVFFGSGPVAEESLKRLLDTFDIECIITKKSTLNEMKNLVDTGKVFGVSNKLELDELIKTQNFSSEIAILIDFGIIVSQTVINKFPLGIVNSHFSLLPQWRGADPITFSLLSGQEKTGVSLMIISTGMDEGKILGICEETIDKKDNAKSLTNKLIRLSNKQINAVLPLYIAGKISAIDQVESASLNNAPTQVTYSRKLTKQDGQIDWIKSAEVLEREIRAFITWPKSYTKLNSTDIIIKKASVVKESGKPGKYKSDKKSLIVFCGQDALNIESIQPAGKKEMPIGAFLAGYKL